MSYRPSPIRFDNPFRTIRRALVSWFSTVFTLIPSCRATSAFDHPSKRLNKNTSRHLSGNEVRTISAIASSS